jgi:succinate-acetate transporter protein
MGGLAQIIAGAMEWKKGNTFAATAFSAYGMFWLTLIAILLLPKAAIGFAGPSKATAMPAFLIVWGIFSAVMFIATLRLNRALQIVFALVTALFFLLALGDITGSEAITRVAGWEGIVCGASAGYVGLAQILNEVYGRTVWPLGPVTA